MSGRGAEKRSATLSSALQLQWQCAGQKRCDQVTVNSPEAKQALDKMVSWVAHLPLAPVTTYMEDPSRWSGRTVIYLYAQLAICLHTGQRQTQSKIAGKFDIGSCQRARGRTGHSAIGAGPGHPTPIRRMPPGMGVYQYMLQPEAAESTAITHH